MHPQLKHIATLLSGFDEQWAFCGGWAVDLWLNRITRQHKDIDITVFRKDQLSLQSYLLRRGWQLRIAHQGQLMRWAAGQWLDLPLHAIWCKHETHEPDFLEVLFNEADETHFIFRRYKRIRRALDNAVVPTKSGWLTLAPEIVLLYKSRDPTDANNRHDFKVGQATLNVEQRLWLKRALEMVDDKHEWLAKLP